MLGGGITERTLIQFEMEKTLEERRTLMTAHQTLAAKGNMVDEISRLSQNILDKLKCNDGSMKENQDLTMKDPSKRDDIVDMFYNISDDLERRSERTIKTLSEIADMID